MRRCRIPVPLLMLAALAGGVSTPAFAEASSAVAANAPGDMRVVAALRDRVGGSLKRFYADRDFKPVWTTASAESLIDWLDSAHLDGLRPSAYDIDDLREAASAIRQGDPESAAEADLDLSAAFARYVRDQRRPRKTRMEYADKSLKPTRQKPDQVMRAATLNKSFADYIQGMEWMSPHYVQLRRLLASALKAGATEGEEARIRLNLDRARLLPGAWTAHVVVDASSARLWYYQQGKERGEMRVVVGARETQTPLLAGKLQWAIVNPYWNVPTYLARQSIAPKVLRGRSLKAMRMEALSDWSAEPVRLDPASVDWAAVAAGDQEVRIRQLPGPGNSMGRVKFLFPNDEGIYLHDTPDRDLFAKTDRHFSNGCIRLQDAAELGRWLLQKPVPSKSKAPEQAVPLPVAVPVYLTYLTATATKAAPGYGFRTDVYGLDAE